MRPLVNWLGFDALFSPCDRKCSICLPPGFLPTIPADRAQLCILCLEQSACLRRSSSHPRNPFIGPYEERSRLRQKWPTYPVRRRPVRPGLEGDSESGSHLALRFPIGYRLLRAIQGIVVRSSRAPIPTLRRGGDFRMRTVGARCRVLGQFIDPDPPSCSLGVHAPRVCEGADVNVGGYGVWHGLSGAVPQ